MGAGVDEQSFVRMGNSKKVSATLAHRCLDRISSTAWDRDDQRSHAIRQNQKDALERSLQSHLAAIGCTWNCSVECWKSVRAFLDDSYPVELHALQIESGTDGFQMAGPAGQSHYLWERWYNGKSPGVYEDRASRGVWLLDHNERQKGVRGYG
jgi:hypothetical protein